ncbi:MAG: hypothetical protein QOG33_1836 [Gaiellales bacterium]|jgi:hypothetical protein|nr:hypothetical protein [Gaiellales bacterium]
MADDWLTLALGVLPPPPARISGSRAEGGEVAVRLIGHAEGGLLVRMAVADAEDTSCLTFAVEAPGRGEYAVMGTLCGSTPVDELECDAVIEVDEVLRWKKRPRVELDAPGTVALTGAAVASERAAPVAVRLLDLSPHGIAFSGAARFRRGDRLRLATELADRTIRVEARVLQVGRPAFGRSRVSCTFPQNDDVDRAIELLREPPDANAA